MNGALPVEIDARAVGLAPADLIFVFGTRLRDPALLAAGLFGRGLSPRIVVTGGSSRQVDGLNEADHHCAVLLELGVPRDAIIVENASSNTVENVVFALAVLAELPPPRTVIAVVKRHHRRALVTLALHVPSIERLYAVDYPAETRPGRIETEVRHMRALRGRGIDVLVADGEGWRRSG